MSAHNGDSRYSGHGQGASYTRSVEPQDRIGRLHYYALDAPAEYVTEQFPVGIDMDLVVKKCLHLVVSWGSQGDTGVFPCDHNGQFLDLIGYIVEPGWLKPSQALKFAGFTPVNFCVFDVYPLSYSMFEKISRAG